MDIHDPVEIAAVQRVGLLVCAAVMIVAFSSQIIRAESLAPKPIRLSRILSHRIGLLSSIMFLILCIDPDGSFTIYQPKVRQVCYSSHLSFMLILSCIGMLHLSRRKSQAYPESRSSNYPILISIMAFHIILCIGLELTAAFLNKEWFSVAWRIYLTSSTLTITIFSVIRKFFAFRNKPRVEFIRPVDHPSRPFCWSFSKGLIFTITSGFFSGFYLHDALEKVLDNGNIFHLQYLIPRSLPISDSLFNFQFSIDLWIRFLSLLANLVYLWLPLRLCICGNYSRLARSLKFANSFTHEDYMGGQFPVKQPLLYIDPESPGKTINEELEQDIIIEHQQE